MVHQIIEFALYNSTDTQVKHIVGAAFSLRSLLSAIYYHQDWYMDRVNELDFLPAKSEKIIDFLFSQWNEVDIPERWLTYGYIAYLKNKRLELFDSSPNLVEVMPKDASHCAEAIEALIRKFDHIWPSISLDVIQQNCMQSKRSRICILSGLYIIQNAIITLPQGTLDYLASIDLQNEDFETGLLIGYILYEGKYTVLMEQIYIPQYRSLDNVQGLLINFRNPNDEHW